MPCSRGVIGRRLVLAVVALLIVQIQAQAQTCVDDDAGREVCLDAPAQRIVALSPGATELLFAAGAGSRVVGAVSHSDYPSAARQLPRVGSHARLDLEALLALEPDLLVAWQGGNSDAQLETLAALRLPVYLSEPRRFEEVATSLERLGKLAGTQATGHQAANDFRAGVEALRARYAKASPVRVFYQVWDVPLMTINDNHLISRAIALCGGVNVFGGLEALVPRLSREAVIAADPAVIVTGRSASAEGAGDDNVALGAWRDFPALQAVRDQALVTVPSSLITRPTPRLLEGTRQLCAHLETARGTH